ncbi:MAG: GntR family transcriptional regulator [Lachnospiraceae bacterium]
MDIIISNTSGAPIYEQIEMQIREMILRGELKAGDALPSMRTLAKDLRISMITTKRAYEELERDGFIESFTGRGSFVKAQNEELLREQILSETEEIFSKGIKKGRDAGLTPDELLEIFQMLLSE